MVVNWLWICLKLDLEEVLIGNSRQIENKTFSEKKKILELKSRPRYRNQSTSIIVLRPSERTTF